MRVTMTVHLQPMTTDAGSPTPSRGNSKKDIPYETFDPNIVGLVHALNRYPGLMTVGSCGGHKIITNPSQWEAGIWYVKFDLHADRLG
jgi:tRNA(Phe) wybutosine-synthesizing methylase Tyw3